MKNKRHEKILELIRTYNIDTQEELVQRLQESGFAVTQATVSRDIRALKLVKGISSGKGYKYILPEKNTVSSPHFGSALSESVIHIKNAGNLVVIKTFPGMASPVASCVDSLPNEEIVGSVAGDDAVLVVVETPEKAESLCDILQKMLSGV